MHIIDAFADLPKNTLTCFTNIVFCASVNYTCVYMYMHVHHGCIHFADSHEVLCGVSRTFSFVHQLSVHAYTCICMAIIDAFGNLPKITLLCFKNMAYCASLNRTCVYMNMHTYHG